VHRPPAGRRSEPVVQLPDRARNASCKPTALVRRTETPGVVRGPHDAANTVEREAGDGRAGGTHQVASPRGPAGSGARDSWTSGSWTLGSRRERRSTVGEGKAGSGPPGHGMSPASRARRGALAPPARSTRSRGVSPHPWTSARLSTRSRRMSPHPPTSARQNTRSRRMYPHPPTSARPCTRLETRRGTPSNPCGTTAQASLNASTPSQEPRPPAAPGPRPPKGQGRGPAAGTGVQHTKNLYICSTRDAGGRCVGRRHGEPG